MSAERGWRRLRRFERLGEYVAYKPSAHSDAYAGEVEKEFRALWHGSCQPHKNLAV